MRNSTCPPQAWERQTTETPRGSLPRTWQLVSQVSHSELKDLGQKPPYLVVRHCVRQSLYALPSSSGDQLSRALGAFGANRLSDLPRSLGGFHSVHNDRSEPARYNSHNLEAICWAACTPAPLTRPQHLAFALTSLDALGLIVPITPPLT